MVIFPLAPDQTIAQMWSSGARGGFILTQYRLVTDRRTDTLLSQRPILAPLPVIFEPTTVHLSGVWLNRTIPQRVTPDGTGPEMTDYFALMTVTSKIKA